MEQDKNKAPVDREEKPKAKRGTCRKPAAKKQAEKPAAARHPNAAAALYGKVALLQFLLIGIDRTAAELQKAAAQRFAVNNGG